MRQRELGSTSAGQGRAGRAIALALVVALCVGALMIRDSESASSAVVTTTVTPVADAYVESATPSTNYGRSTRLIADSSPVRQSFLRFNLAGLAGPLQSARLRIHVANITDSQSPAGGSVAVVNNTTWSETGVTYQNRPTSWGSNVVALGAVSRNTWVEVPVTSAVTVGGLVTLGLRSTNGDGAYYDSRESGANAPQLIVTSGTSTTTSSTSTTTTTTTTTPPSGYDVVIAAVGDAVCPPGLAVTATQCRHFQVSNLLVNDPSIEQFLALGDLQYNNGELANFLSEYDPSYGRVKAKTRPIPGNHEYSTPGATGYYQYFGAAAGDPTRGYYSFDVGRDWHIVTLNGNCSAVSCAASSPQVQWLQADLAANTRPCVIGAWHQPRFSSGNVNGGTPSVAPFWDVLSQHGAEIALGGHEHNYERFAPMLPNGTASTTGIRQIIVGTGGRSLYPFTTVQPNSEVRLMAFGVLKLTLGDGAYSWRFVAEDGSILDSGNGTCH